MFLHHTKFYPNVTLGRLDSTPEHCPSREEVGGAAHLQLIQQVDGLFLSTSAS